MFKNELPNTIFVRGVVLGLRAGVGVDKKEGESSQQSTKCVCVHVGVHFLKYDGTRVTHKVMTMAISLEIVCFV
jgi:hypothetical protein